MNEKIVGSSLVLASVWTRFWAMILDCLVLFIPGALAHGGIPIIGPVLLSFLYYPVLHASPMRATLGKKALGIMVVDLHGEPLTLSAAFIRHLVVMASSCLAFVGHFVAFFSHRKQAVHDLVADSIVVQGANDQISVVDAWVVTIRRLASLAGATSVSSAGGATSEPSMRSRLDELERLHLLREKGALSEEEYQRLKAKLV